MKKILPFRILFLLAALFLLAGLIPCVKPLASAGLQFFKDLTGGAPDPAGQFKSRSDDITTNSLLYHDALMDLNSVKERLLGTRIIEKSDSVMVRADSGRIASYDGLLSPEDIRFAADRVRQLQQYAEENGAAFLYCAVPRKSYYEVFPPNILNNEASNYNHFTAALQANQVPLVKLADFFGEKGLSGGDVFFTTDHHWKPLAALSAAGEICRTLKVLYGFPFSPDYADIRNFKVTTYPDLFLGSYGKKTGRFFSSLGVDDFDLVLPDFPTAFTESRPLAKAEKHGSFEETLIYKENLAKDHYKINAYAAYSGGDFRLQIMKNEMNPEGAKILLIRDSFACAAAPFLALQAGELHICDIRDYEGFVGNKLSIKSYIETEKPDYVLVLYGGVSAREWASGQYDFLD